MHMSSFGLNKGQVRDGFKRNAPPFFLQNYLDEKWILKVENVTLVSFLFKLNNFD